MHDLRMTLIAAACVILAAAPAGAITDGEADAGRHPSVGFIGMQFTNGRYHRPCSGTLIGPDVFLTAAHCVAFLEQVRASGFLGRVWVGFDEEYGPDLLHPDTTNWVPVRSILAHPNYQPNPVWNDAGVLLLDLAAKPPHVVLPEPARLPPAGYVDDLDARGGLVGETLAAVGYGIGRTFEPGSPFGQFLALDNRNVAFPTYLASANQRLILRQNVHAGDDGGVCHGDSGGAIFLNDIVVGVASLADPNCGTISMWYRLDVEEARSFLGAFVALP